MDRHFPSEFKFLATQEAVKACFVSEVQGLPGDCPNCGGVGVLAIFLATEGPYQAPTAPYRSDKKTSHFHDGAWWVGKTSCFPCPDCKGLGRLGVGGQPERQVPWTHKRSGISTVQEESERFEEEEVQVVEWSDV